MHTESDPLACWVQEARAIILLNDYLFDSTTYYIDILAFDEYACKVYCG